MPVTLMALIGRANDAAIVIAAFCLFLISLTAIFIIARRILFGLGINKVFKLPISVFLILIVSVLIIVSSLSSHPLVCQTCHVMRIPAMELRLSSHKGISCISCHRKSEAMAMPIQKLEQARMLLNYLTGNYQLPIVATVGNDACLSCHRNIARGIKVRNKVKMSHREVVEQSILCVDCHDQVAHEKETAKKRSSMMEKCSGCHDNEEASARCKTCHTEEVWLGLKPPSGWGIEHNQSWSKIHGAKSLNICKSCHTNSDCKQCHSVVPHPEGWSYIHGQAAKKDRKDCDICHVEGSFCRGCHQIAMPHPKDWLTSHRWETGIAGKQVCLSCHFEKDCQQCHEKHKHITAIPGND